MSAHTARKPVKVPQGALSSRDLSQGPAARARAGLDALDHLVGGLATAVLAVISLLVLIATAAACLVGVGLVVAPGALRLLRVVADRERARLSR
jgi:hypothetical protein